MAFWMAEWKEIQSVVMKVVWMVFVMAVWSELLVVEKMVDKKVFE